MDRGEVFRRRFWRGLSIDFRRARKDTQSRRSLFLRLFLLFYCVAALAYYYELLHSVHDPATEIAVALVLALIAAIFAGVRFSQWREAQRQLAKDIASTPSSITAHVQRLAHGLAAVTERALGERWLLNNTVPDGHIVVARQISIHGLKSSGAWDDMPVEARAWMMRPDRSWPLERIGRVLASGEILNTLLWALALQNRLRPAAQFLETLSMKKLAVALKRPANGLRPTWDLRPERDHAQQYFWRCFAEGIDRQVFTAADDQQADAVGAWMEELSEYPHKDLLAGAATIRELCTDAVTQVGRSAAFRVVTLSLLMRLLDGEDGWEELTGQVYGALLASAQADEANGEAEPNV